MIEIEKYLKLGLRFVFMDILIESTRGFEKDIDKLSKEQKATTIKKINDCASLFPTQKADVYRDLHHLPLISAMNGYESSLYTFKISYQLRLILSVDEDPIFGQVIFTLFRVVKHDDLDKAYKSVTQSLYQDLLYRDRKMAAIA